MILKKMWIIGSTDQFWGIKKCFFSSLMNKSIKIICSQLWITLLNKFILLLSLYYMMKFPHLWYLYIDIPRKCTFSDVFFRKNNLIKQYMIGHWHGKKLSLSFSLCTGYRLLYSWSLVQTQSTPIWKQSKLLHWRHGKVTRNIYNRSQHQKKFSPNRQRLTANSWRAQANKTFLQ